LQPEFIDFATCGRKSDLPSVPLPPRRIERGQNPPAQGRVSGSLGGLAARNRLLLFFPRPPGNSTAAWRRPGPAGPDGLLMRKHQPRRIAARALGRVDRHHLVGHISFSSTSSGLARRHSRGLREFDTPTRPLHTRGPFVPAGIGRRALDAPPLPVRPCRPGVSPSRGPFARKLRSGLS